MAEPEPDLPPAVVALQQMLLLVLSSARAALDAAEAAVRDPETMRAATQVLGGLAGLVAPLLTDFARFAGTVVPEPVPSSDPAAPDVVTDTGHRAA